MGMMFSFATLGDCSFVTTDSQSILPDAEFGDFPGDFTSTKQLGMLFFTRPNGECYW
jgi:hypothetical protein